MGAEHPPGRLATVDDHAAFEFVTELWRRVGWTVQSAGAREDVAYAVRTSNGERRRTVLRVFPSSEGLVSGDSMRGVVASIQPADRVTAVSLVGFTPDALDVADAHGVDVVGPESVDRLLEASGAADLLEAPTDS
jgi:hypothetical protein